jgi:predicted DNA-binding transcriptional regulator AlpA
LVIPVEPLLDVEDVARILGLRISQVYVIAESRDSQVRLPAVRIGRLLRFRIEDVQGYVQARAEATS